jgi:beta-glucanase (GH16 family)
MRSLFLLALLFALPALAGPSPSAPVGLHTTAKTIYFEDFKNSSLNTDWTIIQRHGEYAQVENECNLASQVAVGQGALSITTAVGPYTCGDFNTDGSVRTTPTSFPYISGDIQWTSKSFTYGTVSIRFKVPASNTGTWPAFWLLGTNCQLSNIYTGDLIVGTCPALNSASYTEIDLMECLNTAWCQMALANDANLGSGGATFPACTWSQAPLDTNWHVLTMVWTSTSVHDYLDGADTGCGWTSPAWTIPNGPMFLIIQTQTSNATGPVVDANLPAVMQVDYVLITQP